MLASRPQDIGRALLAATVTGVLYRYWLAAPVLHLLSVTLWHVIALGAALVIGIVLVQIGLNLATLMCSSALGLILGGACAALAANDLHGDVSMSLDTQLSDALSFSLALWREVALLTLAVAIGGLLAPWARR